MKLLSLMALLCLLSCSDHIKTKEETEKEIESYAFTQAKVKIISVLNDPKSFDAPYAPDINEDLFDSSYAITSYFYSKNGFGGTIKTNYTMNIKYLGGEISNSNNWQVLELYFDGKKVE